MQRQVGHATGEHERADPGGEDRVERAEAVEREPQVNRRSPAISTPPPPSSQAARPAGAPATALHARAPPRGGFTVVRSSGAAHHAARSLSSRACSPLSTRPVLCAFDASEPSILAADVAAWLAGALRVPLELVYVVDHDDLPALPPHGAGFDPLVRDALPLIQEQIAEDAATAELQAVLSTLPHTEVTGSVLTGWPASVIRQRAVDCGATLLVTGTAARQGLQRLLHGSVSGALAASAPCPVVVVPPDAALREPGPVLVGDDRSEHGRRAVRHAEALAARIARSLMPVHVEDGDAAEALARAARDERACLAVTGTRGHGPLRGGVFGSVSAGLRRPVRRPAGLGPPPAPVTAQGMRAGGGPRPRGRAPGRAGLRARHRTRVGSAAEQRWGLPHGLIVALASLLEQSYEEQHETR